MSLSLFAACLSLNFDLLWVMAEVEELSLRLNLMHLLRSIRSNELHRLSP